MTFYVNGIKQQKDQKYKIEMLIEKEQESMVRSFLQAIHVLVLSIFPFSQEKEAFGDVYLTIRHQDELYPIVVKYADPMETCIIFFLLGVEVVEINSFKNPISKEEMVAIIEQARIKSNVQQQEQEQQKKIQEEEQKNMYTDKFLETAKSVIPLVFEKIHTTIARSSGYMSTTQSKELFRLDAELKKLRLWTNLEKIREVVEKIFVLLDHIDKIYFDAQEFKSTIIFTNSVVRLMDVDREREKIENIKILKSVGVSIPIKNQDYVIFGTLASYRKFLQKDIINAITNMSAILSGLYDVVEFVVLIVLALLGIYTLLNQIYLFSFNQFGLAYALMNVGLRGMVIFAARYFRKRNIGRLLLIIAIAILLHYVLMWAVTTNFAL